MKVLAMAVVLIAVLAVPALAEWHWPEPGGALVLPVTGGPLNTGVDFSVYSFDLYDLPVSADIMQVSGNWGVGASAPLYDTLQLIQENVSWFKLADPLLNLTKPFSWGGVLWVEGDWGLGGGPYLKARILEVTF